MHSVKQSLHLTSIAKNEISEINKIIDNQNEKLIEITKQQGITNELLKNNEELRKKAMKHVGIGICGALSILGIVLGIIAIFRI